MKGLDQTDELQRIRDQYEEERLNLEREQSLVGSEMERVYAVWVECLGFLSDGDFRSLSYRLAS